MVRFLNMLAEMFSAFAVKLFDLANEMPETLDESQIRDIVREEMSDDEISTSDISGLEGYVDGAIDEYDFSDKIDERLFHRQVQTIVFHYARQRGIDCSVIQMHQEEYALESYLLNRWNTIWLQAEKDKEARIGERAIKRYLKENGIEQPCPPKAPGIDDTIKI